MVVGGDLDVTRDLGGRDVSAAVRPMVQSTELVVMALDPGGVQLLHHPTGAVERRAVDWVVLAVAPVSEDRLYRQLRRGAPGLDVRYGWAIAWRPAVRTPRSSRANVPGRTFDPAHGCRSIPLTVATAERRQEPGP